MNSKPEMEQIISVIEVLAAIVLVVLLLALASVARAQEQPRSVEFDPAALEKARTALLLKSGQSQLADLEGELNHLAVLSETCRVEFGAQACGLDTSHDCLGSHGFASLGLPRSSDSGCSWRYTASSFSDCSV